MHCSACNSAEDGTDKVEVIGVTSTTLVSYSYPQENENMERNSEYYNKFISDSNIYSITCRHNINATNHNHCQLSVTY